MTTTISFQQDSQLVNQLLELLTREQGKLVDANIDTMEALLEEKSGLLQRMNESSQSRYQLLAKQGFEANEQGMTAWLLAHGKPAEQKAWGEFQKALSQAKELNRLNGLLINKHFNRHQQLLSHIQSGFAAPGVYGRNGQASSQAYKRAALLA